MYLGIDIGSTTIKCALLDEEKKLIYQSYNRHNCQINDAMTNLLAVIKEKFNLEKLISEWIKILKFL